MPQISIYTKMRYEKPLKDLVHTECLQMCFELLHTVYFFAAV